jgi:hypothetical protein
MEPAMSAQPDWMYFAVFLVGASLMAAVYLGGLVISLRRWHLGTAPRLAAAGFGLLLFETVAVQLFQFIRPLLFGSDASQTLMQMAAFQSAAVLIAAAGTTLVVLGLRRALSDFAISRSVLHPDE